jgi:hypothetical protein
MSLVLIGKSAYVRGEAVPEADELCLCAVTRLELLYSTRSASDYELLEDDLQQFRDLRMDAETFAARTSHSSTRPRRPSNSLRSTTRSRPCSGPSCAKGAMSVGGRRLLTETTVADIAREAQTWGHSAPRATRVATELIDQILTALDRHVIPPDSPVARLVRDRAAVMITEA